MVMGNLSAGILLIRMIEGQRPSMLAVGTRGGRGRAKVLGNFQCRGLLDRSRALAYCSCRSASVG